MPEYTGIAKQTYEILTDEEKRSLHFDLGPEPEPILMLGWCVLMLLKERRETIEKEWHE